MKLLQKYKIGRGVVFLVLCLYAVVQLFPLVWLVSFSLKDNDQIFGSNVLGLPKPIVTENYMEALRSAQVGTYLWNSLVVTGITILLTIAISCMASFAIARLRWKFSSLYLLFITLGMMIPVHASLLPLFQSFSKMQILNSRISLILPYLAFAIPLATNVLTIFFRTIPHELEEAAVVDGCNIFQLFLKIMMPMVKPAVATVSIFTYLSAWNELMFATTFVNKQELKTLTVGIMSMVGQYTTRWGPIGAGLVIATLPSIIGYIFVSAQLPNAISAGAVKG